MLFDIGEDIQRRVGELEQMSLPGDGDKLRRLLFVSAYQGRYADLVKILQKGVSVDTVEEETGMTALHYAVGTDHLQIAQLLVESKASFMPDNQGRWPSTIAAMVGASDELSDYILEAEEAAATV